MMPLLEMHNIHLHFPKLEKSILSNISLSIYAQDFMVVLGSNGSGKSSLLKIIARHLFPTDGKILLNSNPIKNYSSSEFNRLIKTLNQNPNETLFTSLTVWENYLLIKKSAYRSAAVDRKIFSSYLSAYNAKLPNKLDQLVSHLSGGEKQTLALALIAIEPPQLLLLDEHTSALDPQAASTIMSMTQKIVEKSNITCIFTTHNLNEAVSYGNRVLALKNGQVHAMINRNEKNNLTHADLLNLCY